jgi:predicted nucleic acid-binding protein
VYRAVLDTCVLVPGRQRDFLLQLAVEGAYAPLWGTGILFELDYVLARLDQRRGADGERRREWLLKEMRRSFPGASVDAPKDRAYRYQLTDRDDGHVAHAAIIGKADAIVTDDSRAGFASAPDLVEAQIEVVSPVKFASNLVSAHPLFGAQALRAMSARLTSPPRSPLDVLEDLRQRYGMTDVAEVLAPLLADEADGGGAFPSG